MVKVPLAAVSLACRWCSIDQTIFGCQLPLRRKIAPLFKGDSGRIAWGYR